MFKCDVLCIGSATVDHFLTTEQSLSSITLGDKVLMKSLEIHSGGGATNAGAALAKLGLKVKILTKHGNDHNAEFVKKELKEYKVKNICLHPSRKSTDFAAIIASTKENDRVIYVHKGASLDLNPGDFKKSQLNAKWIYLASLMGKSFSAAKEIALYAHKKNIPVLFNPSLYLAQKGKKFLRPVLNSTTLLVLNKEEARALLAAKSNSPHDLLYGLHGLGIRTVVITNGNKRLYALDKDIVRQIKIYSLTPPKVKVVNTAGAGDAFTAGLLAGIIKRYSFDHALRLAQVNALSVIQHVGTKDKLLTERETRKLIQKHSMKVTINEIILK